MKQWEQGVQLGYLSLFLSPRTRRHFGLPDPGLWRFAGPLQAPWIFARETLRRHVPGVDDWIDRRARRQARSWVEARLGPRRPEYKAVEQFAR